MNSPFPGMDPYLERYWRDVHASLIAAARAALNRSLPPDLVARSEERVYVETEGVPTRAVSPDVRVVERPARREDRPRPASSAVAEPIVLQLASDPVVEHFIQIVEVEGGRVVTALEFLSPANKLSGDGREVYLKKRREFLDSDTNLVEIDLVRAGDWMVLMHPFLVPAAHRTTYRVFVRRAASPQRGELYPIGLRQRLPVIPIPLRPTDRDVPLDLQGLLEQVYETGRYDRTNYSTPCGPPLEPEDAAWADALLKRPGVE